MNSIQLFIIFFHILMLFKNIDSFSSPKIIIRPEIYRNLSAFDKRLNKKWIFLSMTPFVSKLLNSKSMNHLRHNFKQFWNFNHLFVWKRDLMWSITISYYHHGNQLFAISSVWSLFLVHSYNIPKQSDYSHL